MGVGGCTLLCMADDVEWAKQAQAARDRGDRKEALRCYLEAMAAAAQAGNLKAQMHHARHAGDVYRELGQYDEAYAFINIALGCYKENPPGDLELANTLRVAALIDEMYPDIGRQAELWREAGELYAKVGIQAGVDECARRLKALREL
jgi:tetratricopeptide (TPR) repeat protein